MKILLLGEFSALHKNLKEGLQELGHEAVIAASGDGWKNIKRDIDLNYPHRTIFGKARNIFYPLEKLKAMSGFEVVQLMNPFIFHKKLFPSKIFIEEIIKRNDKFFLLAAGDDAYFWRHGRKSLKYGPFDDFLQYDCKSAKFFMESDRAYRFNNFVADNAAGIIPIMYEYEKSYENHSKLRKTIPIPINTSEIKYINNIPNRKLIIFHGLNRYGFKGTRHVEEAFDILQKKYPNDLELIIDGEMPLSEYLELMKRVNIVIDQTSSHSCGVGAIYALAMGKIVLSGAEPESLISLGIKSTPVINIIPNAASIVSEIEKLLEKRNNFEQLGFESRRFAEVVHGHVKVAKQYIQEWRAH